MGQFGNQPDFATTDVKEINPDDNINNTTYLNGSVIYIGDNVTTGDHMKVIVSGVRAAGGGVPTAADAVTFKGLQAGGFLTCYCGLCTSNWDDSWRTYSG